MEIASIFSFEFVCLSLACFALTLLFRSASIAAFGRLRTTIDLNQHLVFRDVVLPIVPIVAGAVLGAMDVLVPEAAKQSNTLSKAMVGMVAGLLSAFLYGRIKSFLGAVKDD